MGLKTMFMTAKLHEFLQRAVLFFQTAEKGE